tara:strand:+ start:1694 stop:2629 length:936 start_codon:yes stop_codon:yes gene_type:complete
MSSSIFLSVVSPMHNEEGCAQEFLQRVYDVCAALHCTFEIIIIDDGSTDKTLAILNQSTISELKVLPLTRNTGQTAAIYAGIQHSCGEHIIIIDSDLQNLPEEIPLLLDIAKTGIDCVSGVRTKRTETFFTRKIPSKLANFLLRSITGCPTKDMGGFKCINGDLLRDIPLRSGQHRFLPVLIWIRGGSVQDVAVSSAPRTTGKSHYGLSRVLDVLFDIILLWFQYSFKQRPIYLFGYISLWIFLAAFSLLLYVCIEKFLFAIDMGTRPVFFFSLIGVLLSFFCLAFGFMLEILSNVLNKVTDTMPYRIKKR